MSAKNFIYTSLVFGLFAVLISAVYPSLSKPQCLSTEDVVQAHNRSREGISLSCNETIRLVLAERQRRAETEKQLTLR